MDHCHCLEFGLIKPITDYDKMTEGPLSMPGHDGASSGDRPCLTSGP